MYLMFKPEDSLWTESTRVRVPPAPGYDPPASSVSDRCLKGQAPLRNKKNKKKTLTSKL